MKKAVVTLFAVSCSIFLFVYGGVSNASSVEYKKNHNFKAKEYINPVCFIGLTRALRKITRLGYNVIYSDRLIEPWMIVPTKLVRKFDDVDAVLKKILSPYGLQPVRKNNSTWLIVRGSSSGIFPPIIAGQVFEEGSKKPVSSGKIRVDADANKEGHVVARLRNHQRPLDESAINYSLGDINKYGCFWVGSHDSQAAVNQDFETLSLFYHDIEFPAEQTRPIGKKLDTVQLDRRPLKWVDLEVRLQNTPHFLPPIEEVVVLGSAYRYLSNDALLSDSYGKNYHFEKSHFENNEFFSQGSTAIFNSVPGAFSPNIFTPSFHLRGGAIHEVKMIFDGVEIINPYFAKSMGNRLYSVVDPEIVGGGQLLAGGFSAKYANALSGIIEIDRVQSEDFESPFSVRLTDDFSRRIRLSQPLGQGDFVAQAKREVFLGEFRNNRFSMDEAPTFDEYYASWRHNNERNTTFSFNYLSYEEKTRVKEDNPGFYFSVNADSQYAWVKTESSFAQALSAQSMISYGRDQRYRFYHSLSSEAPQWGGGIFDFSPKGLISDFRRNQYTALQTAWRMQLGDSGLLQWGGGISSTRGRLPLLSSSH